MFLNPYFTFQLIKHYLSATPIDVLHSPFIFNLYRHCVQKQPVQPEIFKNIEQLRKQLKQSDDVLKYEDYGALAKSKHTTVGYIAKTHAKPARIARIIYYLTAYLKPQNCIELGTSLGLTTAYMAGTLADDANFISIEGCKDVYKRACENMSALGLNHKVKLVHGLFDAKLPPALNKLKTLDCMFVDGNHTFDATLRYFNLALPFVHNNSFLIFDDIYWSSGMTRAWQSIIHHPAVTVSMDLFFIGIVFFRKEQRKQNFRLRIW